MKKECYAYSETLGCRMENFDGKCECKMTDNLKQRLAEIRARADKATEGPWEVSATGQGVLKPADSPVKNIRICESHSMSSFYQGKTMCWANIKFIAHARTDVPALLAVIDKLIEQRDDAMTLNWTKTTEDKIQAVIDIDNAEILEILERGK